MQLLLKVHTVSTACMILSFIVFVLAVLPPLYSLLCVLDIEFYSVFSIFLNIYFRFCFYLYSLWKRFNDSCNNLAFIGRWFDWLDLKAILRRVSFWTTTNRWHQLVPQLQCCLLTGEFLALDARKDVFQTWHWELGSELWISSANSSFSNRNERQVS